MKPNSPKAKPEISEKPARAAIPTLPERREFIYAPPPVKDCEGGIEITHRGEDYLIVNKPAGLLSVPGKSHPDCVQSRLLSLYPNALTIHRLDLATSGLMVFALTPHAQRHIGLQFEKRQTEKTYIARVDGHVETMSGTIDLPLIADWPNRPRQMVCHERGKPAFTAWERISADEVSTRLALHPKTGRSHQLRVHMYAIGHPILGDMIYANERIFQAASRLQLHAQTLSFREPTGGARVSHHIKCPF